MTEVIQITETTSNVRIFTIGTHRFFIEDWSKKQTDSRLKTVKDKK
ncbi:MAG: hypothetical protein JEY96_18285 [Bacteroidales bacterium]|jgi:hypothetical protein|nr:hypothetical protein [Bacteroidales bacterium]